MTKSVVRRGIRFLSSPFLEASVHLSSRFEPNLVGYFPRPLQVFFINPIFLNSLPNSLTPHGMRQCRYLWAVKSVNSHALRKVLKINRLLNIGLAYQILFIIENTHLPDILSKHATVPPFYTLVSFFFWLYVCFERCLLLRLGVRENPYSPL